MLSLALGMKKKGSFVRPTLSSPSILNWNLNLPHVGTAIQNHKILHIENLSDPTSIVHTCKQSSIKTTVGL